MFVTCFIYIYMRVSPVSDLLTTMVCGGWNVYYHVAPCCGRNTLWETYGEPMGWGTDRVLLAVGFCVCFSFMQSQYKYPYKLILLVVASCNISKYHIDKKIFNTQNDRILCRHLIWLICSLWIAPLSHNLSWLIEEPCQLCVSSSVKQSGNCCK